MSADIVNLRQARKRKQRAEKEANAAVNRAFFGRSGTEKRHAEAMRELEGRELSGKQRVHRHEKDAEENRN